MLAGIRHIAVLVLGFVLLAVVVAACGGSEADIDSTATTLTAQQYFEIAEDYLETGENQKAIDNYDEAIRLDPQYANAYNNRGLRYALLGQVERA